MHNLKCILGEYSTDYYFFPFNLKDTPPPLPSTSAGAGGDGQAQNTNIVYLYTPEIQVQLGKQLNYQSTLLSLLAMDAWRAAILSALLSGATFMFSLLK